MHREYPCCFDVFVVLRYSRQTLGWLTKEDAWGNTSTPLDAHLSMANKNPQAIGKKVI